MLNHPTTIGLKHNHAKGKSSQKSEVPCLAPKSVFKNTLQASNSKLTLAPKDRIESMAHSRWGCMRRPWQHGRVNWTPLSTLFCWEEQFRRIDDGYPQKKYLKCLFLRDEITPVPDSLGSCPVYEIKRSDASQVEV